MCENCRFACPAYGDELTVERIYREVRVNAIGGGSEEIMLDLAGRQLFGG